MEQPTSSLSKISSPVQRYGLALFSVAVAFAVSALLMSYGLRHFECPLFLIAVAVTVWYTGARPAIVAFVTASFAFVYLLTAPYHRRSIGPSDLPMFIGFLLAAILLIWFSAFRRRMEQALLESRQQLEQRSAELEASNKELEAFAYSVSHDLRAPLRHTVGFAELLQKNAAPTLDQKSSRYLTMIIESATRMGTLIDDLLAFSRIGRAEPRETTVSLTQLVSEVQTEAGQEANGRNIDWKIGLLPDLYGDRSMLKLAFMNLVSNAIKFTRINSQPRIEIGLAEGTRDGTVVFVRDNGVGFDMKYVNKLFGVFQRLHGSEFEGTGIGLATVKRIVHRHGGTVWAEALVGHGATFYLSFPNHPESSRL